MGSSDVLEAPLLMKFFVLLPSLDMDAACFQWFRNLRDLL